MFSQVYVPQISLSLMVEALPYVLEGLPYTLGIAITTFITGNLLGVFLAFLDLLTFKPLKWFLTFYLSFLRGVPALVLLFILYFGLPYQLSALTAVIICFTLTCSAFSAEVYRGAISGVDQGQWDAARALGWPFYKLVTLIVLPQAFRLAIPALGNIAMDLVKGTALAAMITVPEIFQKAKIVGGREFDYMSLYVLVALIYWSLCIIIDRIQRKIEVRYGRYI